MFDKLIVSEPEGAEFKPRRAYFMVSSLVVGVLFLAAVVISIFASDYRLGASSFELTELIAPPSMLAVEPEPPKLTVRSHSTATSDNTPSRKVNMPSLSEHPIVPKDISVVPNTTAARPNIAFRLDGVDRDPVNLGGPGRDPGGNDNGPAGLAVTTTPKVGDPMPEPPPIKVAPTERKPVTQSLGVINGRATSLPKPNYPAAAIAVNAQGKVDVQVTIDEHGKVVSAKAVNGNPLLRGAAETAARKARFSPTLLSNVHVKVTGVIIYNFNRG
jgi:TonB family protein